MKQAGYEGVSETSAWVSGRKRNRRDPDFVPPEPEVATIVIGEQTAFKFFGARNRAELRAHLKELRAAGRLIHEPDRLTSQIRVDVPGNDGRPGHVRGYVIRGRNRDIPMVSRELRRKTLKKEGKPTGGRLLTPFTI